MTKLASITYQGGKTRIAEAIIDQIQIRPEDTFYDLCCGCGAISMELVNRGHSPSKIHMLDAGPWGKVWQDIGSGSFDLQRFADICNQVPRDKRLIKQHMEQLSKQDASIDTSYVYLLLQASSFGGKAIWTKDNRWQNCSFRRFWEPTATSSRRSHVNPMMPMPDTMLERMTMLCEKMRGVNGYWQDIRDFTPKDGVVYIDPPYSDTEPYGNTFDVLDYARSLCCYVSEGRPLTEHSVKISGGRSKGGISGERSKEANEEWLSRFGVL